MKKKIYLEFIILETNHIHIECKINNKKGNFIVDTGASNSCINYLSASKFNIELKKSNELASSATNKISETYYSENNTLTIGNFQKKNLDFILFDMTFINNSLEEKGVSQIDGILGSDILNELKACINYKKKEIILEF